MHEINQNNLKDRREPRYLYGVHVKIRPINIFSKCFIGQLVDLNMTGACIDTDRLPPSNLKARIHFQLHNKQSFEITACIIWQKQDPKLNKYYSGWRFLDLTDESRLAIQDMVVCSSQGDKVSDRRQRQRRHIFVNRMQNSRKRTRRLSDFLNNFDLLSPLSLQDYRRLGDDRRGYIRRDHSNGHGISDKRIGARRVKERRSNVVVHDLNEVLMFRSINKLIASIRDYIIFWMPAPLARKIIKGRTFAFITHPRDTDDVCRQYPFAKLLPSALIKIWLKWQWPVIGAEIKNVPKLGGGKTRGWLIFCPLTAKQMIKDRNYAQYKVLQAVRFAEKVGAKIVGLGAFTSIVTHDGKDIADKTNIGVTTGNALSAAAAIQNTVKIAEFLNMPLSSLNVAIVGAAGNVGSVCARTLYGNIKELILVDINKRSLNALCAELEDKPTKIISSTTIENIRTADIIIAVTNAPGAIVRSEHLKKGAAVIDAAQPKNVSDNIPNERSDVIVIESAILKFPDIDCHFDLGIGAREALGCMAETIVLDAIGWHKNYSIGKLSMDQARNIMAAAKSLGIDLAYFRNSQGYVAESDIKAVKENK